MTGLAAAMETHPVVVAPGVADPLTARLVERAGFPAVYISGGGVSNARFGVPDVGIVSRAEMTDAVAAIAGTTSVPAIADGDAGYGGPASVRATVRGYESAGAAAIHIEDQTFPKVCGYVDGAALVSPDEMCARIEAAVRGRRSSDFQIIARTEARVAGDIDETIRRAHRYAEAGADLLFVNALATRSDVARLPGELPLPLLYNNAGTSSSPTLTVTDARELGYRVLIHPTQLLRAALASMMALLEDLAAEGSLADDERRVLPFPAWLEVTGIAEAARFEDACWPALSATDPPPNRPSDRRREGGTP